MSSYMMSDDLVRTRSRRMASDVDMRTRTRFAAPGADRQLPSEMYSQRSDYQGLRTGAQPGAAEFFQLVTTDKQSEYIRGDFIAAGSFGSVYTLRDDPHLAMKTLKISENGGIAFDLVRELNVFSQISHPNVQCLKLVEVVVVESQTSHQRSIGLVSPLATSKSLGDFMKSPKYQRLMLDPSRSYEFFYYLARQMVAGASAVNRAEFVHQDIKPDNYLVFDSRPDDLSLMDTLLVKLADMGSATLCEGELSLKFKYGIHTHIFAAPEMLAQDYYDTRSDTWAVGISLLQMLTGDWVFGSDDVRTDRLPLALGQLPDDSAVRSRVAGLLQRAYQGRQFAKWNEEARVRVFNVVMELLVWNIRQRPTTTRVLERLFNGQPGPVLESQQSVGSCVDVRRLGRDLVRNWTTGRPDRTLLTMRKVFLRTLFRAVKALPFLNIMSYAFMVTTMDRILDGMRAMDRRSTNTTMVACMTLVAKCLVDQPNAEKLILDYCWAALPAEERFTLTELLLAEAAILKQLNGNITIGEHWEECNDVREVGAMLLLSFKPGALLSYMVATAKKPISLRHIVPDKVYFRYFGSLPATSKRMAACNTLTVGDALQSGKFRELGSTDAIIDYVTKDEGFGHDILWEASSTADDSRSDLVDEEL